MEYNVAKLRAYSTDLKSEFKKMYAALDGIQRTYAAVCHDVNWVATTKTKYYDRCKKMNNTFSSTKLLFDNITGHLDAVVQNAENTEKSIAP